jgi:hypothetical protein
MRAPAKHVLQALGLVILKWTTIAAVFFFVVVFIERLA